MLAARQTGTEPELSLREELLSREIIFHENVRPEPSLRFRADFLFETHKLAVFIDGCFWHGCPIHGTWPKANQIWWRSKIEGNRARDARAVEELTSLGWSVMRFWSHDDKGQCADLIERTLGTLE